VATEVAGLPFAPSSVTMRLFAAGLVLLVAGGAHAGSGAPQLSLVEVFETGQALVYDRASGEYALVREGSELQGFTVEGLDADQLELMRQDEPGRYYIVTRAVRRPDVAASPPASAPVAVRGPPAVASPREPGTPMDPYARPEPMDPYAADEPAGVKVTEAPAAAASDPLPPGVKITRAPPAAAPPSERDLAPSPAAPTATAPRATANEKREPPPAKPAVKPAPKPAPPRPSVIRRAELEGALADLERLSEDLELAIVPGGVEVLALAPGTLPHRLGVRRGDIIESVAGIPIRGLEDGADVYVKLTQINRFAIALRRAGQPLSLPVHIK
jgi:hypothetical protein